MKLEMDKDGLTLISEDPIDYGYLDHWTRGKKITIKSYGIKNNEIAELRIEFEERKIKL